MKKTFAGVFMDGLFFPHNCRMEENLEWFRLLQEHGVAGSGIYWGIMELLRKHPTHSLPLDYNFIRRQLLTQSRRVQSVVEDFGLFKVDKDAKTIESEEITSLMNYLSKVHQKRIINGKKGSAKRWAVAGYEIGEVTDTEEVVTKFVGYYRK